MKPTKTTAASPLLPVAVLNRASALLVAREVRRPPETLAFLAQRLLRWWTVIKGIPTFDPPAFKSLARDFRDPDTLAGTASCELLTIEPHSSHRAVIVANELDKGGVSRVRRFSRDRVRLLVADLEAR